MKLLSVERARTVWIIDTNEFNPHGRNYRFTLIPASIERYKFVKYPGFDEPKDPNDGYVFESGVFTKPDGTDISVNFTAFRDGIVAETRSSTSDTDAFLHDYFQWASENSTIIYKPEMIQRKGYVSELNVQPDRSLKSLDKFERFASKISSFVSAGYQSPANYQFSGIIIASDPEMKLTPAHFRLERSFMKPFSENKYFSQAPLPTDVHLEMLNELESFLSE